MVTATAREAAAATPDPELPQLTIDDLGILRSVEREGDTVVATITPTYSGCPAIREIGVDLRRRLAAAGFARVEVRTRLAPPWSSDWVTAAGRARLAAFGIAPPAAGEARCPRCGSAATERVSEFGSTPCKAHYRCTACREPFDRFKCI